jgi:hypothetical protein
MYARLTPDKFLYPMAEFANILWPLIFTKALYKLFAFKWKEEDPGQEVGDGAIMYALTGLLPCTFSVDSIKKGRVRSARMGFGGGNLGGPELHRREGLHDRLQPGQSQS